MLFRSSVHTQTTEVIDIKDVYLLSSTRCLIVHTDIKLVLSLLYFDQSFLLTSFFPSDCLVYFTGELQILECCTCIFFVIHILT